MTTPTLSIREITPADVPLIANYWLSATPEQLLLMGAEPKRMPQLADWTEMLTTQINTPHPLKKSWCIIWLVDGTPVGHCNINKIIPGKEAYMHLHLWQSNQRNKGLGLDLLKITIPNFFEVYDLKTLYCEPYALNPAPNNALRKLGFTFVHEIITTPGILNFEQPVNLWSLTHKKSQELFQAH